MEKISQVYRERRERVLKQLTPNSLFLVSSGNLKIRNNDTHYPFRPHSDFYYLTGYVEPDAVLILAPNRAAGQSILCHLPSEPAKELWDGKRVGHVRACTDYYFDEAFPIDQFEVVLSELLVKVNEVYYPTNDIFLKSAIDRCQEKVTKRWRVCASKSATHHDVNTILHEMRLIKDAHEIETMRQSAKISALAHKKVMQALQPGMMEYVVEANLNYEFMKQGSRSLAYSSIVAGGENACTLHYIENNCELKEGDLVLIDAGGEYAYYASDITRTYPVGKQFSLEQKAIYNLVLKAQEEVIAAIKPGVLFDNLQACAVRVITAGLIELGILKGSLDTLIEEKAYQSFYMHRVSHWLGLDVHDVGAYRVNESSRALEAGMVLTVEPGIYIAAHTASIDKKWLGIGVRIEDDVLVTSVGADVLTKDVPKQVDEIESLRCLN